MITRDNCSLSLIISAGGAVNISSMENIFRTEAAWYKELRGVISSSSCIWNTYSLLQLFKTVHSNVQVQEECVTGAVHLSNCGCLHKSEKSLVSGRGECVPEPATETEISQRWTGRNPERRLKLNNICIYDDNNDYIENTTEEQLKMGWRNASYLSP